MWNELNEIDVTPMATHQENGLINDMCTYFI